MTTPNTSPRPLAPSDLAVFVNAAVDSEVSMTLHMRAPDDDAVSILFGTERMRLEFFDVESLDRLRDLAEEGARKLRAAIALNEMADARDEVANTSELAGATGTAAP